MNPCVLPIKSDRGFTLVETLIALFVLAAGLLATAGLLAYAVASNLETRNNSVAGTLAVQQMEQMKGQTSGSLIDGGSPLDSFGNIDYSQSAVSGYSVTRMVTSQLSFDIRWNISTSNGLRKIVVAARPANGQTRTYMTNLFKPVNVACLIGN